MYVVKKGLVRNSIISAIYICKNVQPAAHPAKLFTETSWEDFPFNHFYRRTDIIWYIYRVWNLLGQNISRLSLSGLILCRAFSVVARSYVPNSYSNYSFLEETRVGSQLSHVSLGTSSLGWIWPWSSLFIVVTLTWTVLLDKYLQSAWCLGSWQMHCWCLASRYYSA